MPPPSPSSSTSLGSLPQDLTLRIIATLPISSIPDVACLSRRFKVLAYNDALWEYYLRKIGISLYSSSSSSSSLSSAPVPVAQLIPGVPPIAATTSSQTDVTTQPSATSNDESQQPESTKHPLESLMINLSPIPPHVRSVWSSTTSKLAQSLRSNTASAGDSLPQSKKVFRNVFKKVFEELFGYYVDFRKNSDARSSVFVKHTDPTECAQILCKLICFSSLRITNDFEKINAALRSTVEYFESKILSQFDRAYDAKDFEEMRKYARLLWTLNGGKACIHLFIYKEPIFYDHNSGDVTENFKVLSLDGGENSPLHKYLNTISNTIHSAVPIIDQIFPNPEDVILSFVQKAFDECIFDYLNKLLSEAQNRDLTIYLQSLTHIFMHCSNLIQSLSNRLDGRQIEKLLHKVLIPFNENYMEQELGYLKKMYDVEIEKWDQKLAANKKSESKPSSMLHGDVDNFKRKVLSSVKTVLLTPQHLINRTLKSDRQYQQTIGGWGIESAKIANELKNTMIAEKLEQLDQLDTLLSLEVALQMIHINKESMKRCVVMMGAKGDVKSHVESIFIALLKHLGNQHIKPGFNLAIQKLGIFKASNESNTEVGPLMQFFEMVHIADLILQMVHLYFTEEIRKFVDINDFLAPSVTEKKKFEHLIDDMVASGLDQAIRVLMDQVEYILAAEQAPTDYLPEDEEELDLKPTAACQKSIECMTRHANMLVGAADKQVMEVFLSEIGQRFFSVLCKHIKRMQINEAGGFQLICDLNAYHAWSQTLKTVEVTKLFNALKELANIYIISDRASLKPLLKDQSRYHGVFRVEEVYEFVERRADYEKVKDKVKESECIIM